MINIKNRILYPLIHIKRILSIPQRINLRSWAKLDDIRQKIKDAGENGRISEIPPLIYEFIDTTMLIRTSRKAPWYKTVALYGMAISVNHPTKKFPMLSSKEKENDVPWEYLGRTWYFWLHIFAEKYGWSEKEIAKMDIDDAIGLYEEILVSEQIEKEFTWSLSEIAYPYDKNTKKSKYHPMERPDWMKPVAGKKKPLPKTKILRSFMPQGNVVQLTQDED